MFSIVSRRLACAAAEDGRSLDCKHFSDCSGCNLDVDLPEPPLIRHAGEFFSSKGCRNVQSTFVEAHEWRCRARLAVRGGPKGGLTIGLFRSNSHVVEPIPDCRVHHPRINEAVRVIHKACLNNHVSGYQERIRRDQSKRKKHKINHQDCVGLLRYLQLTAVCEDCDKAFRTTNESTALIQAVFVVNCAPGDTGSLKPLMQAVQQIKECYGPASLHPLFHSLWLNFQMSPGNKILGDAWEHLSGEEWVWQRFAGVDIALAPGSFVQANYGAMDAALRRMHTLIPSHSRVLDLHAGVGTIGLSVLAAGCCSVLQCVEINPAGEAAFAQSLARLRQAGINVQASYHVAAAGDSPFRWFKDADVIIVDPPRKGLEPKLLENLKQCDTSSKKRLLYLSCGFEALMKDSEALLSSGVWKLAEGHVFVFFPGTDSLETLAVFDLM